ncbi:MAG: ureidoglycolate hydrolase-domain-containing protein [Olpidium bornovanus]|uniref:Ureidoglycolate hydrolase-domain-containing protein n=1 Tax=Olpidium bornovanus TaxID=278681 RepID=A0A8H7ZM29_9FUNG|nr:MAG: ureidoglycolate hydrolase-domain-containing protein [Olpidium bornovanus]
MVASGGARAPSHKARLTSVMAQSFNGAKARRQRQKWSERRCQRDEPNSGRENTTLPFPAAAHPAANVDSWRGAAEARRRSNQPAPEHEEMSTDGPQLIVIKAEPLTAEGFAPYGWVVAADAPDAAPTEGSSFAAAASANQGTARRFNKLSPMTNYRQGAAEANVCVFRSVPTPRLPFPVRLLERHPFSTQMFVPMTCTRGYLVIVCTSRRGQIADGVRNPPDPAGLKAFIAKPGQAITYDVGVWHHPIIALEEVSIRPRRHYSKIIRKIIRELQWEGTVPCRVLRFSWRLYTSAVLCFAEPALQRQTQTVDFACVVFEDGTEGDCEIVSFKAQVAVPSYRGAEELKCKL